jgi:hypothetical protein
MWRFITFNEWIRSLTAPESCWLIHKTGPHFYDQRALGAVTDKGYYRVDSRLETEVRWVLPSSNSGMMGILRWLQLDTNKYGLPGADLLEDNAGSMIRTSRNIGMQSGYLDVFDSAGNLIWSAASASKMPRVVGFLTCRRIMICRTIPFGKPQF